jgi:hypothetical protein
MYGQGNIPVEQKEGVLPETEASAEIAIALTFSEFRCVQPAFAQIPERVIIDTRSGNRRCPRNSTGTSIAGTSRRGLDDCCRNVTASSGLVNALKIVSIAHEATRPRGEDCY